MSFPKYILMENDWLKNEYSEINNVGEEAFYEKYIVHILRSGTFQELQLSGFAIEWEIESLRGEAYLILF